MVLESIFTAKSLEEKPWEMLIMSLIVSLICIYIAYIIFPQYSGVIAPLLITVAMTPVVFRIFKIEEGMERAKARKKSTKGFWDRHGETIIIFTMFFIGNFLAVFLISLLAPEAFTEAAFYQQIEAINVINPATGSVLMGGLLNIIFVNNLKVLFFAFLLSFLIGTGALFILSWNASVLAVYLATFINKGLYSDFILRSAGIAPHAPIEILAYFLGGIAGGILSVGVIREKMGSKEFNLVFRDSLILLGLAVVATMFGAFLEVFI